MTVSIVLCTYNRENYLGRAIDSVLAQTYTDWELILVDDGSTDHTEELVRAYTDPRIHYYKMEKNRFYCYAANFGLKKCKGDLIAFQNSDDEWQPDKLEKQVAYLEAHPEAGACFSAASLIDNDGKDITGECQDMADLFANCCSDQRNWMHLFFYYGNSLCHPTAVVRKQVMDQVGGFNLLYCQLADFDLWIRIVTDYPIHVLPEKLIRFRWDVKKHDQVSSVTEGHTIRTFNEQMMIRRQLIERLDDEKLTMYFQSDFKNPDSHTPLELEFERAFLLMKCVAGDPDFRILGLQKLEELLRREGAVKVLEEHFGLSLQEVYAWNQNRCYYDPVQKEKVGTAEEIRKNQADQIRTMEQAMKLLRLEQAQLRQALEAYENSKSWKLTAPVRKAGKVIRQRKRRR